MELFKISEFALEKLINARELDQDTDESFGIRISVKGGGCSGYQYQLDFENEADETDVILLFETNGKSLKVMIDEFSNLYLNGVTLDFVESETEEGFKFSGGGKKSCACGSSFSA